MDSLISSADTASDVAQHVGSRIKEVRSALKLTQVQLCERLQMPLPSHRDYEYGKRVPPGEVLVRYASLGVNAHWLLTGEGPMLLKGPQQAMNVALTGVYAGREGAEAELHQVREATIGAYRAGQDRVRRLAETEGQIGSELHNTLALAVMSGWLSQETLEQLYKAAARDGVIVATAPDEVAFVTLLDVEASAGPGGYIDDELPSGRWPVARSWLKRRGLKPEDLRAIRVRGTSMPRSLPHGAIAIVNVAPAPRLEERIYAVRLDGHLLCKLVRPDVGGGITLLSEAQDYPPVTVSAADLERITIIGPVVSVGRDL